MNKETIEKIEKMLSMPENQKFKHNLETMNIIELKHMRKTWIIACECYLCDPSILDEEGIKKLQLNVKTYDYYIEKRMKEMSLQ